MRSNGEADPGGEARSAAVRDDDRRSGESALRLRLFAVAIATLVVIVDQGTKAWAQRALADGPIGVFDGILDFRLFANTGVSFSLFAGNGAVIGLVVIGVVVMIFFALRDAGRRIEAVALGLILGGAIGNFLDRLLRGGGFLDGAVVDFIHVPFFATFNGADVAINVGVALLLIAVFLRK